MNFFIDITKTLNNNLQHARTKTPSFLSYQNRFPKTMQNEKGKAKCKLDHLLMCKFYGNFNDTFD